MASTFKSLRRIKDCRIFRSRLAGPTGRPGRHLLLEVVLRCNRIDNLAGVDPRDGDSQGEPQYSNSIDPDPSGYCQPPLVAIYEIRQYEFHRCTAIFAYFHFNGGERGGFMVNREIPCPVRGHRPISAVFCDGDDRFRFERLVLLRRILRGDGPVHGLVCFYGSDIANGNNYVTETVQRKIPPRLFYVVAGFLDPSWKSGCYDGISHYLLDHYVDGIGIPRNDIDACSGRIDIRIVPLRAQFAFYDPGIRLPLLPRAILRMPQSQVDTRPGGIRGRF